MALERQNAPVSLAGGLDTKTDPKQVVPGKLLVLENGVFTTRGKIRKRNGYQALGSALGTVTGVFSYQDEIVATTGTELYSLDRATGTWRDKGPCWTVGVTDTPVVRNDYSQSTPDTAILGNLRCVVWADSRGGCRYSVIDTLTGQHIVDDASLDPATDASGPQVVALDAYFAIFYFVQTGTTIYYRTISASTPTSISSATTVSAAANAGAALDVTATSVNGSLVAFLSYGSASNIKIQSLNSSLTLSGATTQAVANSVLVVGSFWDGSNIIIGFTVTGSPHWSYFMAVSTVLAVVTGPTSIAGIDATVTGGPLQGGTTVLIYSETATGHVTRLNIGSSPNYSAGTATIIVRGATLGSKAFTYGGVLYFASQVWLSAAQQCCFVHDSSGNVVARLLADGGQGALSRATASGAVFSMVLRPVDRLALLGSGFTDTRYGIDLLSLDLGRAPLGAVLAGTLHLTGGALTMYDGVSPVEHGFFFFPIITATAGGAGSLTGTFGYTCVYEWTDGQGNLHRSAPSAVKSASPSGATGVTITITTLRITAKKSPRVNVQCVVYRTINNGSIYYRYTGIGSSSAVYNDPTVDSITFQDNGQFADGPLQSNPTVYTTGNVLESDPAPASTAIAVYKNRLLLVDAEHPLRLWYSKQVVPGQPVEWNEAAVLNVDPVGGVAVTALAALDDKLVVFKRDVVYFLTGTGPDSTGAQNDFSAPLLINTNSGCIEPRSVATASDGVMYQSAKGIYLLDRGLRDSYIGAEVEAYNAATVTGAELVANANEARFTLSTGQTLMYDYLFRQWSVFTGVNGAGACTTGGRFSYITPSGQFYQETPGAFLDGSAFIPLKFTTSWLSLAGLQGFQRAYKLLLLGDWISAHNLLVSIAVDYDPTIVQSASFSGQHTPLQWRVSLSRQKCQAMQIHVEDSQSSPYGEGFSLSALTFEVGTKRGPFRLPASQAA